MSKTTNEPYESVDLHKKNNEIFIAQIFKDSSTNNKKEEDLYKKLLSGQKNSGVQINLKSQLENNVRTFNNLIEEYPNHSEYIEKNKNEQVNYLNAEFGKIFPKNYTKQEKQDLMDGVIGKIQKINDSKSNITKAVGNFFSAIENMLNMGVKDVDIMKIHQAMSIAGKPSENKDITSNKAIDERLKYDFSFIKTEQITSAKIPDDKRIRNIKNNISKYVSANQQPKPRELNAAFKNISRPVPPPSKGGRER